ncbi:hypothetical protein [Staphylococcus caprae]|nr:hypothetical protein [Staphylococcus caprae]
MWMITSILLAIVLLISMGVQHEQRKMIKERDYYINALRRMYYK